MSTTHDRSTYEPTSGSDEREPRPMMQPSMVFDLGAEIERLRGEEEWARGDRASRTLAKEADFRVLLSALKAGARLTEEDGDARVSIYVVDGSARLDVDRAEQDLGAGALAVVDAGVPWSLTADGDCSVLLTLAWPRAKAGSGDTGER